MRILSVSNGPHDPNSGAGHAITGYTRGLRRRGHVVDAYGPSHWKTFDVTRARRYVFPLLMAVFGIRVYASRSYDYDVVELWGGTAWLLAVLLRWGWSNLRIVHHSNGIEQHRTAVERNSGICSVEPAWFQVDFSSVYDWGLQAADAIVTIGSYDVPFLKRKGYVPEERIYAIENPLPDRFIGREVTAGRPKRIGYCGSWIPRKGTEVMKVDIPRFLRAHPSWTFSIVGSQSADVEREFPDDVRDQIEVTPFMERDNLVDWYHSLSIFTLPSIYESFGLVVAEAMACGAAVVTTNVGFAHGLTHKEEACILEEPASPHLKETLTDLARNEDARQTLAANGYERVQSLRWEKAIDRLEQIYRSLSNG